MRKAAISKIVVLLLVGIFCGSAAFLAIRGRERQAFQQITQQAVELSVPAQPKPPAPLPEVVPSVQEETESPQVTPPVPAAPSAAQEMVEEKPAGIDLDALRQVNPEVVGWIEIPDTMLSYPIVQAADNQYYLTHAWDKTDNYLGSIYLDYRNDAALDDFNTILYGHRMRGDDMFGSLRYYQEEAYLKEHPAIRLTTDTGIRDYHIFAVYEIDSTNCHTYRLGLEAVDGQEPYLTYCTGLSVHQTGIVPTVDSHILTLSTCTNQGGDSPYRWVVQAVWQPNETGGAS